MNVFNAFATNCLVVTTTSKHGFIMQKKKKERLNFTIRIKEENLLDFSVRERLLESFYPFLLKHHSTDKEKDQLENLTTKQH